MSGMIRISYVLGWVFAAVAVLCKGLDAAGVAVLSKLPVSPRGVLFFAGFLFLATIASAAYEQSQNTKGRGAAV